MHGKALMQLRTFGMADRVSARNQAWLRARTRQQRLRYRDQLKASTAAATQQAVKDAVEELRQKQKAEYNAQPRSSDGGNICK